MSDFPSSEISEPVSEPAGENGPDEADLKPPTEGSDEGTMIVKSGSGIVIEKNDRSLSEFHRWVKSGRLIIDPDWQREYVWGNPRASRLIESILVDIPVPVIYLAKNDDGKYEVIDGLQRLTSIFRFFDNEFALSGLEILSDFNRKRFRDLSDKEQNKLTDATLRTFELSPQTPKDMMFVIFERLNTGGISLNEMEIRNAIYRGRLNDLLKELAKNEDFIVALNQKNISQRMVDRALVLRFLAFYERTHYKLQLGLKRFLNEFLEAYRNPADKKLKEYRDQFCKAMRASKTIFGSHAFRLRREFDDSTSGGEWATRPNAAVFQVVATSFTNYDIGALTRRADAIYEEYLDMVSSDAKWCDCVRRATGETSRIEYVFSTWNERLGAVMKDSTPNDSQRVFTAALKREMYDASRQCALCQQEIKLLNDAALDHDIHYWRGGKTVPDNARLVHRTCNLKRPN